MPYITSIEQLGFNRGLQQGIEQGIEKGMQQGIEKGMQQGIEKGIEQGLQQLRSVVPMLLTAKFGELPEDVLTKVQSIREPEMLSQLSLRVMTSASLHDFMQFFPND
ncbi:MAG: hypothetical protein IPM61_15405 [Chlorobi bacterium]|nr:MAG: flagellar assembly protein H [Chlorobi bacterium OLB7]MBK8912697.1 hypothetical protein [Chlorobiota bacterium]MBX7216441.1 hypothetical protein [Candidatus Kapabacteria bacterium]